MKSPLQAKTSLMIAGDGSDLAGLEGGWAGFTNVAEKYLREY